MAIELGPGVVIGARYRLVRLLGEGGMGVVWAAEDIETGLRCALKLMKDDRGDPGAHERFLREGRAMAAVRHPNVVCIVEVIEPEGEPPALIMELLEGESLRARLVRERKLPLAALAEIMVPVVSAVGAAHTLGIVHRDLKPENIFLVRGPAGERTVKVLDFGIAKLTALDGETIRSTGITTGSVLGTPAYMAPEQADAKKDLDHRADIWMLGLIVYECLAGACPTEGDNLMEVFKHVFTKPFEPLHELVPEVPEELSRLVARMLARDPAERPADLHEVLEVLAPFASTRAEPFGAPAEHLTRGRAAAATVPVRLREGRPPGAPAPPAPPSGSPPTPRRARRRAAVWSAAGLILLSAGGGLLARPDGRDAPPSPPPKVVGPSPLEVPGAKLACPVWRASGVEQPAGWLGAAAAATACERARVILGGRPDRTLVPAELLDLPRRLVDDFGPDPYGKDRARDASVAAAGYRAQAYLDGEVERSNAGFAVAISLRRPDGTEIKSARGHDRSLFAAVRSAMDELVRPGLIPKASQLDPEIAPWSRTHDVDPALSLLDLRLAMSHNAGNLDDECARFEKETSGRVGELGPAARWLCAYTMGLPAPKLRPDAPDASPEAVATRIRIRHFIQHEHDPFDVVLLHVFFERDATSWGQSLLAATESCLEQASHSERAYELALTAVLREPKNPDGQVCDPWGQLMTMARGNGSGESASRAMHAWMPWNGISWYVQGLGAQTPAAALLPLRRAYELSPFNAQVAGALADKLLAAGKPEEARRIAVELQAGGHPVHSLASQLILLRVDASKAQLGAALARAQKVIDAPSEGAGWVRAQRFEVAWRALELAAILGRATALADVIVQRFVDPDPLVLDGSAILVPARIAAVCALASAAVSARCFTRFQALRGQISGGITSGTETFLRGAQRYALRDLAGAARAWRPLLREPEATGAELPDAMAETFERAGELELAERVDEAAMLRKLEFNGATLGHVRAARRALARGDRAKARALAGEVIAAWSVADKDVPAVAQMRRLLARP
jgi:hypothetical protein